jgi:L-lactate dehydrogenase complex protein LldF
MSGHVHGTGVIRPFPEAAREALRDSQLRRNLAMATSTIRAKRARVVAELPDWDELRAAGAAIKERTLRHLDTYLLQLEEAVARAGGQIHWAADADEATRIIGDLVAATGAREIVKVKSITSDEIGLNDALQKRGIEAVETDLAELIVQMADDTPSHILVPAIHKNRAEIREVFARRMGLENLSDRPEELAEAARIHLRERFLRARVAVSGANFAVAETGAICVVESEGNGRMCLTLPETLITVMGIEKVIPTWQDLEVFLQLLPRSSTGERMNPYTSLWTGVHEGDGPREFHLVLLDNGRTNALRDTVGRQALRCIRCSACLNVCPVYERTGGHAYGSVYPGPIGAILTPQLRGVENAASLPFASSLCGACYEVCPVAIDIPRVLVHLRGKVVRRREESGASRVDGEALAMRSLGWIFAGRTRYEGAQRFGRMGQWPLSLRGTISRLPGPLAGWTAMRDAPPIAGQTFREWWRGRA